MKLNLAKKKELSAKNIADIVRIGVNFGEKINQISEKCVEDYKEDTLYAPKMLCIYDNYIWECKYSTQGTFDNTKWTKLTDELSLIDLTTIKSMIGLSQEQIDTLQKIILDTEIKLTTTWSSSKIYSDIQQCLSDSKTYTLQELAKKTGASYKVASSTADITETEYLYLLSNGTDYDIYALIDGTATKIGTTTIDISQFYTKTEIDNDFLKKTDAQATYATIISLSNHELDTDKHTSATEKASYALKSSITDTIDSTSTSNDIASAKGVYDGLNGKVDKSSIVTTLSSTNTDEQVPSAKSVYDRSIKIYNSFSQLGLTEGSETLVDIGKAMEEKSMGLFEIISTCNSSEYPYTYGSLVVFKANDNRVVFNFYPTSDTTLTGREYVASYHESKDLFLPWKQIQTESTNDVASTKIELDSTLFSGGSVYYEVRNSICYVSIEGLVPKATGTGILVYDNIPIPKRYICVNLSVGNNEKMPEYPICARILSGSSNLVIHSYDNTKALYGSFSYPVA